MEKTFSLRKIRKQSERCTQKELFFRYSAAYVRYYGGKPAGTTSHERNSQPHRTIRKSALLLGVLCSGVAYVFWYDALKVLPASKVGALLYLEPLVSLGVAAGVLGERITGGSLVRGAIIFAGVWIVTRIR